MIYIKEEGLKNPECKKEILSLLDKYNFRVLAIKKLQMTEEKLKVHQPILYKSRQELKDDFIFERNQLVRQAMLNSTIEIYILKRNNSHLICKQIKDFIRKKYSASTLEEKRKDLYRNYMHSTVNKMETEKDVSILMPSMLDELHKINGDFNSKENQNISLK